MLFSEFGKLIGCNVTQEEYHAANAVYMALSWDKEKFCGWYKKNRHSEIFSEILNLVYADGARVNEQYYKIRQLEQRIRSKDVILKTIRDAIGKIAVTYSEWGNVEIDVRNGLWCHYDTAGDVVEKGEFFTSKNEPGKVLSITRNYVLDGVAFLSPKVTNAFKLIGYSF